MSVLVFPDSPSDGQQYEAPNGALYTYNSANDSWTGELDATLRTTPNLSNVSASPSFVIGSGTFTDPYILTPAVVGIDGSAYSQQQITVSGQTPGKILQFINYSNPFIANKFQQPDQVIGPNGTWVGKFKYDDAIGKDASQTETNVGIIGIGTVIFSWKITQEA